MKNVERNYEAPALTGLEVEVEKGFAQSPVSDFPMSPGDGTPSKSPNNPW